MVTRSSRLKLQKQHSNPKGDEMNKLALIGADPEAFVQYGVNISHAIGMIGGTKDKPLLVDGGGLQEDNVLFEFNVDPTDNPSVFAETIKKVLEQGEDVLAMSGLRIKTHLSSHVYEDMSGFPEKAFEFGCTPDYNAFTGAENPRPSATNQLLRTAGGHVHIGYSHITTVTDDLSRRLMMMCDYLLGLPSLFEDNDTQRRELYGKAGACRLKSYGAEYRTLSNYWIWDEAMIKTIHGRAQNAFLKVDKLNLIQALIPQADCQEAINTNDKVSAKAMLEILNHAAI